MQSIEMQSIEMQRIEIQSIENAQLERGCVGILEHRDAGASRMHNESEWAWDLRASRCRSIEMHREGVLG